MSSAKKTPNIVPRAFTEAQIPVLLPIIGRRPFQAQFHHFYYTYGSERRIGSTRRAPHAMRVEVIGLDGEIVAEGRTGAPLRVGFL